MLNASLVDVATRLLPGREPAYRTRGGAAYVGDALDLLRTMPDDSVNLVVTSPPYAREFKKEYGNDPQDRYVEWFLPFGREVLRVLRPDGSFVVNIGGAWGCGGAGTPFDPSTTLSCCWSWSGASGSSWRRRSTGITRPRFPPRRNG